MKSFLVLLAIAVCSPAFSQQDTIGATPDAIRSRYITSYPEHFFVWPVIKQRRFDFELKSREGSGSTLRYKTNKPYSLGIGLYLFELGFELAFAVPLDEQSKIIYGESKSRDIQLNILGKKWGADLFLQRYSGFYLEDSENPVTGNTPYLQRRDIVTRNIGIGVNRIFNTDKFSFRSAYNFIERQLASSGAPVIFASLDNFSLKGDSALIGDNYLQRFGESSQIRSIRSTYFGIAPGYTYSLIFKGFFINGALAFGPVNNWLKYEMEDGMVDRRFRLSGYLVARLAIGYNGDKVFGGMTFMNNGRNAKFEDIELTNSQSSFKILFGFRFRESGILRNRVTDLPKQLLN